MVYYVITSQSKVAITYPQQLIHLKLVLTSRNNLALGKIDNKPINCRHNS